MKRIDALLEEYGESHQNPVNKVVHWVCVPVIVWTVMAGLYALPMPGGIAGLNWLTLVMVLALIYYVILSPTLAIGMLGYLVMGYWIIHTIEATSPWPLWQVAALIFVLAWIGQFWGHMVEGKKPSFLKDVQFLLIGPAWLLSFVYRRLGIPV
ncbi:Mpo1-like protein [Aliiroseovarius subalbicans]|uniref:Mpo1 family 2-hydroxy fatty acid dioxygenase n=1 Tax=Aliiroseovarius subalbicans TaxID=2925840 RepID=UPI001F57B266|nr:Mpo1-like protein [Aliiroseovarius subalbicans]MCI2399808.1 DUF962 domain-containing protein [Aliiroseovarius subalbicans]